MPQVSAMTDLLNDALLHAQAIKPASTIEPPLTKSHFDPFIARLPAIFPGLAPGSTSQARDSEKVRLYAAVETAARKLFSSMVVSRAPLRPRRIRQTAKSRARRPTHRSTRPILSESGISSTSFPSYPTTNSAIRPFFSGSSKSCSIARPSMVAAKFSIFLNPGGKG